MTCDLARFTSSMQYAIVSNFIHATCSMRIVKNNDGWVYSDIDSFIRTKRLDRDEGGRITIYLKEYLPESGTSLFSFSSRSCTQPTTTVEKKQSFWHILQVRTCIIRVPRLKVIMEKKSYLYKNVAYWYTMDDDAHSF